MGQGIRLENESVERAVEMADGFWMIATRHRPGFSNMMPEVNNRCLIFRLRDDTTGKPVLVVANGVDPTVMPEVRRIERETGLDVRYIVSVGGGHHLMLPAWRDEFTKATVLVGPARVPRTASAKKLMEGGRLEVMDPENPLPQFKGQLDAVLFGGLLGFRDHPTPFDGGNQMTMWKLMKAMMHIDDPVDELWLRHPSSETIVAGENLGWILSPEAIKKFPFMMRMTMKPNTVFVNEQARKVGDPARVAASWEAILKWPARTLMGYHEPPGEAFTGDGRSALAAAARAARQVRDATSGAAA